MRKMQKRSILLAVTVILMAIMTTLSQASSGQSFWYGDEDKLYEILGNDSNGKFKSCLADKVIPYLNSETTGENLLDKWYGKIEKITEMLSDDGKIELQGCLSSIVQPVLNKKMQAYGNYTSQAGVTIHNKKKTSGGYTLLNPLKGHLCSQYLPQNPSAGYFYFSAVPPVFASPTLNTCSAILIDMNGDIVKEWPLLSAPAKMLPDGSVLGMAFRTDITVASGGIPTLMQLNWQGDEILWQWSGRAGVTSPTGGARVHHDFQREGNPVGYFAPLQDSLTDSGKSLILSNIDPLDVPAISKFPLIEEPIYEVAWDGSVLSTWRPSDHFDQMGFSDVAKDAIMNVQAANPGGTDWQHLNSASYLGKNKWYDTNNPDTWVFHPENIIFDSRTSNYIGIIASLDHPEGKWHKGEIVWRIGPDYSLGNRENTLKQIIGPHMAHMIPQGLPGAGNILVFDNGGVAGFGALVPGLPGTYPATYRDYSRIIEFNPKSLEVVWEYKNVAETTRANKVERKFYSMLISGAQRLANGNTMITEGMSGRVFEVTKDNEIVWEYNHRPEYANGFKIPGLPVPPQAIYRAYRVPAAWIPISP